MLEKLTAMVSWVLGQLPVVASLLGVTVLSIYQNPSIYHGKELFLIGPFFVGVVSTWLVFRYERFGIWVAIALFVVVFVTVFWVYEEFPPGDKIHGYNWVLSYCVPAILLAIMGRAFIFSVHYVAPGVAGRRYQEDFGDTTNREYTLTHNLNSRDVLVRVMQNPTLTDFDVQRIERPSANTVKVTCTAPPGASTLRVLVLS